MIADFIHQVISPIIMCFVCGWFGLAPTENIAILLWLCMMMHSLEARTFQMFDIIVCLRVGLNDFDVHVLCQSSQK